MHLPFAFSPFSLTSLSPGELEVRTIRIPLQKETCGPSSAVSHVPDTLEETPGLSSPVSDIGQCQMCHNCAICWARGSFLSPPSAKAFGFRACQELAADPGAREASYSTSRSVEEDALSPATMLETEGQSLLALTHHPMLAREQGAMCQGRPGSQ